VTWLLHSGEMYSSSSSVRSSTNSELEVQSSQAVTSLGHRTLHLNHGGSGGVITVTQPAKVVNKAAQDRQRNQNTVDASPGSSLQHSAGHQFQLVVFSGTSAEHLERAAQLLCPNVHRASQAHPVELKAPYQAALPHPGQPTAPESEQSSRRLHHKEEESSSEEEEAQEEEEESSSEEEEAQEAQAPDVEPQFSVRLPPEPQPPPKRTKASRRRYRKERLQQARRDSEMPSEAHRRKRKRRRK
jgi:hypothetical protein